MADKPDLCPEKLEALFNKHDFNKDETIEYKEIKPILRELGYTDEAIDDCNLDLVSCFYCYSKKSLLWYSIKNTVCATYLTRIFIWSENHSTAFG